MPAKMGRPKSKDPREKQIGVRLTMDEWEQVTAAAEADDRSLSDWCRLRILEVIAHHKKRSRASKG